MTGKARRHHATGNHYNMSGCISDNGCVSLFWYDADGTVEQIINYYPFGAPFADPETVVDADLQPYKYNGKELDRMHGLDTYDYGARLYDPILGRWDRMDPMAERKPWQSPYVESSGQVFDSSAHPGARASRPLLMRTGTSALLYET